MTAEIELAFYSPSPTFLEGILNGSIDKSAKSLILDACLVRAAAHGASDIVEFLLSPRCFGLANPDARDADGMPALVAASFMRHSETVRLLIEGHADIESRDAYGWTALMWAVQAGDCQIAAYLLNHGASLESKCLAGLTAADLLDKGQGGNTMREILLFAQETSQPSSPETQRTLRRGKHQAMAEQGQTQLDKRISEAAREAIRHLDVDTSNLGLASECLKDDTTDARISFDWKTCAWDQMLVFRSTDIPALLSVIVDDAKIQPGHASADVIFLCCRYAGLIGPKDLLERFLSALWSRIEDAAQAQDRNLALLAYWLSNTLTLLYYWRMDEQLGTVTSSQIDANVSIDSQSPESPIAPQGQLLYVINELLVFLLRDVERRLDSILESSMLDYESLPHDVQFEDEWKLARAFTLHKRGDSGTPGSLFSLFTGETASPKSENGRIHTLTNLRTPPSPSGTTQSPRSVSATLSAFIFVLQQYRLPTFIILHALSQLFYWISCALFNTIMSQKRHLCRSRAMQIRLNVSAFEEWTRSYHLPPRLVLSAFGPLNALLQWLQCLSSERSVEDLKSTLESVGALNPLQVQRAVVGYRHEVDELHMGEECQRYISHLCRAFEEPKPGPLGDREAENERVSEHLDALFMSETLDLKVYEPPPLPRCNGDALDSRHMLPFGLPSTVSLLAPHRGAVMFGPFASWSPQESRATIETVPFPPDDLFDALDFAASRVSAARAIAAHNAVHGLGTGHSPDFSARVNALQQSGTQTCPP